MTKSFNALWSVLIVFFCCLAAKGAEIIPIDGQWRFGLDRTDAGISDKWFNRDLPDAIQLPGALQSQGFGNEISIDTPWVLSLYDRLWYLRDDYQAYTNAGSVKVPFVCQPPRHYLGAAWYQREIEIPQDWEGRRLVLFLERPHWESRVWLDDQLIGTNNSLCAPHEFELGMVGAQTNAPLPEITPGKHRLTVRVDNRMILLYRPDAHAVSDSLNSTWNGIVGKMELRSTPAVWIEEVQVFPDLGKRLARIHIRIGNNTGAAGMGMIRVWHDVRNRSEPPDVAIRAQWDADSKNPIGDLPAQPADSSQAPVQQHGNVRIEIPFSDDVQPWDEFNPKLQRLRIHLSGDSISDSREVAFGFRDFTRTGNKLFINGRETHLRGTHHGGDFPLTGYPPTDVEYWRKLISTCKEWGLNHMRFHSFCPPEAAFQAADELGFYLQPEPGMWNAFDPGSPMEKMLYLETERMIKAYGNHPTFVMLSPSNEPKGRWKQVLPQWAEHFRGMDSRRLYTSGTGFTDADAPGPLDKVDFVTTQRFGSRRVRGEPGWFGRDYSASLQGVNVPVLGHELGQWCAYPDYSVIEKFTGYMRPGNYEIFRDSAEAHGLFAHRSAAGQADAKFTSADGAHGVTRPTNRDFTWASGRFQVECYKEEIEANLRTPGMAGFQLLDLHEYVGQGTALVGLLDPFWESKGYVTAEEFRQFCNPVVPLARLKSRVLTASDKIEIPIEIANFSAVELPNERVSWEIRNKSGKAVAAGELERKTISIGRNAWGKVSIDGSKLTAPAAYELVLIVGQPGTRDGSGPIAKNTWNFWVYPAKDGSADGSSAASEKPAGEPLALLKTAQDVFVTSSWADAEAKLATGGKVLFQPRNADLDWTSPPLDNLPVFWNRLMNPGWSRMLGLWCDTNHPALAEFPTAPNCDWQWTQILGGVRPVNLDRLPRGLQPIVQPIDDWNRNWKLGALFECRVGSGRLLVSSFDLGADQPVARQLRRSVLAYMAGPKFQPKTEVSAAEFRTVLFDSRVMRKLEAKASGEGNVASAIDGDPNTYWLAGGSARNATGTKHPHQLSITFPKSAAINGVVIMPRQNDRDHLGDVREYKLEYSDDGRQWQLASEGELKSNWSPQRIQFARTISASQLRFTALSGFGRDTSSALAELAVIYAGPKLADDASNIQYRRSRSTSADVDEGSVSPVRSNAPPRNP